MHLALQREMAGCGVGLMVEVLNGPINGYWLYECYSVC